MAASVTVKGVVRGRTIELEHEPGLPDGQQVTVTVDAPATDGNGVKPNAPSLPAREAEILQRINAGLPHDVWTLYHELCQERTADTLTPPEQQELIALSDRIEEANADRMAHVAELANLRRVSIDTIVRTLGLPGGSRAS